MQDDPRYDDVVREVRDFLHARASACVAAGIDAARIVVDPGFGFGKTLAHNAALVRALPAIAALGYPVLAGLSRKGSLGTITGRRADDRPRGSIAAALARSRMALDRARATTCAKRSTRSRSGRRCTADCAPTRARLGGRLRAYNDAPSAFGAHLATRRYFGTDGIRGRVARRPSRRSSCSSSVGPPVARWWK
jgi:hypothetical protein